MNSKTMAIFENGTWKPLIQILTFLNLYQNGENKFIPSAHFRDIVDFRVL